VTSRGSIWRIWLLGWVLSGSSMVGAQFTHVDWLRAADRRSRWNREQVRGKGVDGLVLVRRKVDPAFGHGLTLVVATTARQRRVNRRSSAA